MEKRIEEERRGRAPEEVLKLNLDNCQSEQIEGLTDEFKNLTSLSLVNAGLSTLKGFPKLPQLKKLDLSDNRLSGELDLISGCTNLTYLNLSGNHIKDVNTLEPLKSLKNLRTLDLFNCEVTNGEGYKEKVFELLENLLFLDGFDKNGEEADVEDGAEDESDEDDEDDEEDDDDVGLEYLQKPGLEDESEGEEFAPGDENEVDELDDDDSEEDEEESGARGTKRKRGDDNEDDDDSKDG